MLYDDICRAYRQELLSGEVSFDLGPNSETLILFWNSDKLGPQPLSEQGLLNIKANQPILRRLETLDIKTIRALREGDSKRITDLEAQAAQLRSQLHKV